MVNEINTIILCNNPIAIPGIREFLFYGKVKAIVVTQRNKEMQGIISEMLKESGVPMIIVNRKNFAEMISGAIEEYAVNVGLVMTFPFILPAAIVSQPAKGFINFHYGLLPQCRGPQPILWHMLRNDPEAGVTLHKMDEEVDTGPIILQEKINIEPNDTYGMLQSKLAYTAAKAAAQMLKILSFGSVIPATVQDESKANYYEMPSAADLTIRWSTMSADEIVRLVNACNPWNKGAGSFINEWFFGIAYAAKKEETTIEAAGTILSCDEQNGLVVSSADQKKVHIIIIYTTEGFLPGYRMESFGIKAGMKMS